MPWPVKELDDVRAILKGKKLHISQEEIFADLARIELSQKVFPQIQQKALMVQLLHAYENSKKKVVIQMEELGGKKYPLPVIMGVLAEDWSGMANSILGIIHQKQGNVLFVKGFTLELEIHKLGIVILSFMIRNAGDHKRFLAEKSNLQTIIKDASQGSVSKTLLLEDETVRFDIYGKTIKAIRKMYREPDIENIIGENGEALKFISSRSREYLQERKLSDLATLIIDNYRFQKQVREGKVDKKIKIKNFETIYEKLTGITFVCWEENFSVENFLKTLDFIVPGHIIKHHKSFVSREKILVYRIEIVDSHIQPLNPVAIKTIEGSLAKLISTSVNEVFCQIKSVGGYEHYARAIIPFLMEEKEKTGISQVFMTVEKKTEFMMQLKMIIVSPPSRKSSLNRLIASIENHQGIEILSVIPPRLYKKQTEVNIMNLKINLAEFVSIAAIFQTIKNILKNFYDRIRDFDEGLRDRDMSALGELTARLPGVSPLLIKEIYFNFDEIYRMETPSEVLAEIVNLTYATIAAAEKQELGRVIVNYRSVQNPRQGERIKTIFIVSYGRDRRILSRFIGALRDIDMYFTRIEWEQRFYLILIFKKDDRALPPADIAGIKARVLDKYLKSALVIDSDRPDGDPPR
jgi:hypothetical protein